MSDTTSPSVLKVKYRAQAPASLTIHQESGGVTTLVTDRQTHPHDTRGAHQILAAEVRKKWGLEIPSENWNAAFGRLRHDGAEVIFTRADFVPHSKTKEQSEMEAKLKRARYGHDLEAHFRVGTNALLVTDRMHGGKKSNVTCDTVEHAYKWLADFIKKQFNIVVHPQRYAEAFGDLQHRKFSESELRDFRNPPQEMSI